MQVRDQIALASRREAAPMVTAVWPPDLAPVVAQLIASDGRLAQRLVLAPRRTVHGLAIWLHHALERGLTYNEIARRMVDDDVRDLVAEALPGHARRLPAALDRVGHRVHARSFYIRLDAVLRSPAAAALPTEGVIHAGHLKTADEIIAFGSPLTAIAGCLTDSLYGVEAAAGVVRYLREHRLAKAVESVPSGSGWRGFVRRVIADLDAAQTPHPSFPEPPGWTLIRSVAEMRRVGRSLRFCIADFSYGSSHHLHRFIAGTAVFLHHEQEEALVMVQAQGSVWCIQEVSVRGNGLPPVHLRGALEHELRGAGVSVVPIDPVDAFETVFRHGRSGLEHGLDLAEDHAS